MVGVRFQLTTNDPCSAVVAICYGLRDPGVIGKRFTNRLWIPNLCLEQLDKKFPPFFE